MKNAILICLFLIAGSKGFSSNTKSDKIAKDRNLYKGSFRPEKRIDSTLVVSERVIKVKHVTVIVKVPFEQFTKNLAGMIGRFSPSIVANVEKDPKLVVKQLEAQQGEQGLMLFGFQDHGKLLNIAGAPRKAIQYAIGNPIIASTMTRHDIRAGLYAPLHVLVFEGDDKLVHVEYDLPSTLFGQFGNSEVTKVGIALDTKLLTLIKKAAKKS